MLLVTKGAQEKSREGKGKPNPGSVRRIKTAGNLKTNYLGHNTRNILSKQFLGKEHWTSLHKLKVFHRARQTLGRLRGVSLAGVWEGLEAKFKCS